jgi:hypothetical protein
LKGLAYDPYVQQDYVDTPANDFWTLNVTRGSNISALQIVFLADGTVDLSRTDPGNLTEANTIIPAGTNNVTFWQTVNWLYVSLYWTTLIDYGQYVPWLINTTTGYGFYAPSTNNIFLNTTLLQSYSSFYNTKLSHFLNGYAIPEFTDLLVDPGVPIPTTFFQSYSCTKLVPKATLTIIITLAVGCYTFILGGYGFAKFVLAWWHKRRYKAQGLFTHCFISIWC